MVDHLQALSSQSGVFVPDLPAADAAATQANQRNGARFSVCCQGSADYPEDLAIYGTYQAETVVDLGTFPTLERAMAEVEDRIAHDDIDSGCEGAVSFSPYLFKILDDDRRLVLAGEAYGDTVKWCVPVLTDEETEEVVTKANALRAEAAFELGWDNFSTARRLRRNASILESRLVDPFWRNLARAALPAAANR